MNGNELKIFHEPRHLGFLWPGGRPAALLVHGFPGTPAEVRPLATLLQPMGWTVQGLLLPGFGAQFATLGERSYDDWLAAIVEALVLLRAAGHFPIMLAGFSMGAALAIAAALPARPDGLMLLAPFTWQPSALSSAARMMLRPLAPRKVRPFQRMNLRDERMRAIVLAALQGINLDDPAVQESVRRVEMPLAVLGQVFKAGWQAWQGAVEVCAPTLIVQGLRDDIVPAWRTRGLVLRMPHIYRYQEVNAGHRLIGPENLAWATVQESVMDFAVRLEERSLM